MNHNGLRHDSNPTKLGLMDCAGLADAYLIGMSEGPNFDAAMERRFQEYVEDLGTVVGNDARRRGLSDYLTGLLLPGERKSMEPIAERLESGNVSRRCVGARMLLLPPRTEFDRKPAPS